MEMVRVNLVDLRGKRGKKNFCDDLKYEKSDSCLLTLKLCI